MVWLLCRGKWMECPDGRQRKCFPLLCSHVCDHKEALKATNTKQQTCTACSATAGELHLPDCTFATKKASSMWRLYEEHKDRLLDDEDQWLPGKKEELLRIESQHFLGCR